MKLLGKKILLQCLFNYYYKKNGRTNKIKFVKLVSILAVLTLFGGIKIKFRINYVRWWWSLLCYHYIAVLQQVIQCSKFICYQPSRVLFIYLFGQAPPSNQTCMYKQIHCNFQSRILTHRFLVHDIHNVYKLFCSYRLTQTT